FAHCLTGQVPGTAAHAVQAGAQGSCAGGAVGRVDGEAGLHQLPQRLRADLGRHGRPVAVREPADDLRGRSGEERPPREGREEAGADTVDVGVRPEPAVRG
ncbi:MAG: hypothetical protein ACK559_18125, partial [bacterium]